MSRLSHSFAAWCAFFLTALPAFGPAQKATSSAPLVVRADKPFEAPQASDFHVQYASNPRAQILGINRRYLTLNGKPWLPVMAEFHYSRVPESLWETEILKMKAAGVDIVSTYVFWIHHEEVEGHFDWTGRRDLRHFVKLCAAHGMYVWLRIGPWDHGEVRNGGFPNWLLRRVPSQDLRHDDPTFMKYVSTLYAQIGEQVHGLLWNQGGPIIGVQLENEYSMRGPKAGDQYILALKRLAIGSGLRVPIYSVTGWDNAVVPKGAVVAFFGGYPDAPWDRSQHQLPAEEVYEFRFGSRASGSMGVIGASRSEHETYSYGYPFMTAEMGGGVQTTYHRRPVIDPDDVAAMMPAMLGSGVNLYGTYMFQGGINPNGKLTTLQESQATGYPNDLPIKSYDFQAPLSAFGQERLSLRKLKVFDYFLNVFGSLLAPMPAFAPNRLPSSPQDFSVARVAVRTNGRSGFLFFNNYVRYYSMPDRPSFQVRVELPSKVLEIPAKPVNLPSGDYGIWPFGLRLGNLHLRYATAELFSRTISGAATTYYFVTTRGVPPQFVFENQNAVRITTTGRTSEHNGAISVDNLQPSLRPVITSKDSDGKTTRIVLLSEEQAENAWKVSANWPHLLLSSAQFYSNGEDVTLLRNGNPHFKFTVIPALANTPSSAVPLHSSADDESGITFWATLPGSSPKISIEPTKQAGTVPPVSLGPPFSSSPHGVAMAPNEKEFNLAAKWKLVIPSSDWRGVDNLFLEVHYNGDVAHLTSGTELLDDDFYNGSTWTVGLDRFREHIAKEGLELEILPRPVDAPIFLERRFRDHGSGQVLELKSVQLIPQYQLKMRFAR